jgi:hypothetical protein
MTGQSLQIYGQIVKVGYLVLYATTETRSAIISRLQEAAPMELKEEKEAMKGLRFQKNFV